MLIVFFFQAEDGIRAHCVTGVQTCALPIYRGGGYLVERYQMASEERSGLTFAPMRPPDTGARSEERRVGKECRSRGYAGQVKKTGVKTPRSILADRRRCAAEREIIGEKRAH